MNQGMYLLVTGLNHLTAPVAMRERVAFSPDEVGRAVQELAGAARLYEAVILSTCNRTELYGTALSAHAAERMTAFLAESRSVPESELEPSLYVLRDAEAVQHIFKVAAGLDSLVMGEPQILGQVRAAYEQAHEAQSTGARLSRLFHAALEVGKSVRNTTALGSTPVSVATISLQLAHRLLGDLRHANVLVIGAGEMCETAAVLAAERQPSRLTLVNRTLEKAEALAAKASGVARPWDQLGAALADADLVVSGTGATEPVITARMLAEAMAGRAERRMVVIDMGLPRDVEPACGCSEGVFLYDLDGLQEIADEHLRQRRAEVPRAEEIVDQATERYMAWLETLAVVPTIVDLSRKLEEIRAAEVRQHLGKIPSLDRRGEQRIEQLTQAIVNKILHEPLVRLKRRSTDHTGKVLAESLRYLFGLDGREGES